MKRRQQSQRATRKQMKRANSSHPINGYKPMRGGIRL